ncbi:hypothetical protein E2C01_079562 [Portunus trituberculatus]|uniref:Uncharacterized protein n=1 Tax=Portunus trituberculatus TaxID=210409 RepID=A0A5B7ILT9_PORTR|nr:hypothetical protein [Portunus trituberculatus]
MLFPLVFFPSNAACCVAVFVVRTASVAASIATTSRHLPSLVRRAALGIPHPSQRLFTSLFLCTPIYQVEAGGMSG